MPLDDTTNIMGKLSGGGATVTGRGQPTILRGPVDKSGASGGGSGNGNFGNG